MPDEPWLQDSTLVDEAPSPSSSASIGSEPWLKDSTLVSDRQAAAATAKSTLFAPIKNYGALRYLGGKDRGESYVPLLDDIQKAADGLGLTLGISSAYRPGAVTTSGHTSRHASKHALDISTINGFPVTDPQGKALGDMLAARLKSMGFETGEHGTNKGLLWQTMVGGNHFNHLHVSYPAMVGMGDAKAAQYTGEDAKRANPKALPPAALSLIPGASAALAPSPSIAPSQANAGNVLDAIAGGIAVPPEKIPQAPDANGIPASALAMLPGTAGALMPPSASTATPQPSSVKDTVKAFIQKSLQQPAPQQNAVSKVLGFPSAIAEGLSGAYPQGNIVDRLLGTNPAYAVQGHDPFAMSVFDKEYQQQLANLSLSDRMHLAAVLGEGFHRPQATMEAMKQLKQQPNWVRVLGGLTMGAQKMALDPLAFGALGALNRFPAVGEALGGYLGYQGVKGLMEAKTPEDIGQAIPGAIAGGLAAAHAARRLPEITRGKVASPQYMMHDGLGVWVDDGTGQGPVKAKVMDTTEDAQGNPYFRVIYRDGGVATVPGERILSFQGAANEAPPTMPEGPAQITGGKATGTKGTGRKPKPAPTSPVTPEVIPTEGVAAPAPSVETPATTPDVTPPLPVNVADEAPAGVSTKAEALPAAKAPTTPLNAPESVPTVENGSTAITPVQGAQEAPPPRDIFNETPEQGALRHAKARGLQPPLAGLPDALQPGNVLYQPAIKGNMPLGIVSVEKLPGQNYYRFSTVDIYGRSHVIDSALPTKTRNPRVRISTENPNFKSPLQAAVDAVKANPDLTMEEVAEQFPQVRDAQAFLRKGEQESTAEVPALTAPEVVPTAPVAPPFDADAVVRDAKLDSVMTAQRHKDAVGLANALAKKVDEGKKPMPGDRPSWMPTSEYANLIRAVKAAKTPPKAAPAPVAPVAPAAQPNAPTPVETPATPVRATEEPQGASAPAGGVSRNWTAGLNHATVTFENELARDLYDLGAKKSRTTRDVGGRGVQLSDPSRGMPELRESLAQRMGLPATEVDALAIDAHRRVREQMKGVADGETRRVEVPLRATPKAAEAPAPVVSKEPWQMTRKEYAAQRKADAAMGKETLLPLSWHLNHVVEALSEGKPVPPEVLADYPELRAAASVSVVPKEVPARRTVSPLPVTGGRLFNQPKSPGVLSERMKQRLERLRSGENRQRYRALPMLIDGENPAFEVVARDYPHKGNRHLVRRPNDDSWHTLEEAKEAAKRFEGQYGVRPTIEPIYGVFDVTTGEAVLEDTPKENAILTAREMSEKHPGGMLGNPKAEVRKPAPREVEEPIHDEDIASPEDQAQNAALFDSLKVGDVLTDAGAPSRRLEVMAKGRAQITVRDLSKPGSAAFSITRKEFETEWNLNVREGNEAPAPVGPEAQTPQSAEPQTGGQKLALAVYNKLKAGESLGNVTVFNKMAEQAFGSTRVSGEWTPRDAFDAMEAGVNLYLLTEGKALLEADPTNALRALRDLMNRITTQGTRTAEQVANQQFSTPPTEAYVVAKVANLKPTDVVLEPSAGNGGLAVWPLSLGAKTYVNEIDPKRVAMLKTVGFEAPSSVDAEYINTNLPTNVRPTVILMNPPFSASTQKSHAAANRNQYGFNHLDQALQRLAPGGRLVAILGGGQANEPNGGASLTGGAGAREFFTRIGRQYNVRANIRVNGKEYAKYGTSFATRILVIDKDGPTPSVVESGGKGPKQWASAIQMNVDTLEEAHNVLLAVERSRPRPEPGPTAVASPGTGSPDRTGTEQPAEGVVRGGNAGGAGVGVRGGEGAPTGGEVSVPPGSAVAPGGPGEVRPGGRGEPTGLQQPGHGPVGRPDTTPQAPAGAGGGAENGSPERPAPVTAAPNEKPQPVEAAGKPDAPPDAKAQTPVTEGGLEVERADVPSGKEVEDTSAYVEYKPSLKGVKHPANIVETKTMATVPLPPITYKPSLPKSVVESGALSAVQLEAVALAGQQNEIILPNGDRASALIGDGTGVGKGRISAGILLDNWNKGRKRLVWVSQNWDLMEDAVRDLKGLGADDLANKILKAKDVKADKKIEHEGIVFTTYSLIRSEDKQGNTRVSQLQQYLRGKDNAEGAYILFDESHNLKNAVVGKLGQASQVGTAVNKLLRDNPKLRTASLSATAATDVLNLGYLDRLGLWGPGTPFPEGFNQFAAQISSGGMSAMEMIARELKAQGKYIARTLSYKGVTYSEVEHIITQEQKELYRSAAKAWRTVQQRVENTIKDTTNGGALQQTRFMSQFYSTQQRFFNVLLTTLKIPTAVEKAHEALANGKSVVITLVNTNEAAQNREKNKAATAGEDEIPDYDFGPGEMLIDLVQQHYPTQQFIDDVDENERPIKRPLYHTDPDGRQIPVDNPEAIRQRDALIAELRQNLHMPANPLDILIEQLGGHSHVAELTGRKERFDTATGKFVSRGDPGISRDKINKSEEKAFMTGRKRIAVLSQAAGTGISLHASNHVPNKQPRYHITLQTGWSADRAMQMLGRTHRSDQAHAPEYALLKSNMGGETRFISTIAKRLGSLEALGKGQTNTSEATEMMSKVNFETAQGEAATQAFYRQLQRNQPVPGTNLTGMQVLEDLGVLKTDPETGKKSVPKSDETNVTRLLNRLLALDPDVQNAVYDYFYDVFSAVVQRAVEEGDLDTGVQTMPGDTFTVKEERTLATDPKTGARTFYYPVDAEVQTKRVSPKDLRKHIDAAMAKGTNPRIMRTEKGSLALVVDASPIVHADGTSSEAVHILRPGNGVWQKVQVSRLGKLTEVQEYAEEAVTKADREVGHKEQVVEMFRKSAQQSSGGGYGDYYVKRLERAEQELEEARKTLADAEAEAEKSDTSTPEKMANLPAWKEQYEAAPVTQTVPHHLIGGAVLRYWNPIQDATSRLNIYTVVDSKSGKRVVGIEIPPEAIGRVLERISGQRGLIDAGQIIPDVLNNNMTYRLERGIQVKPGRVGGHKVVQLVIPSQDIGTHVRGMGILYERGVLPIYYVPEGDKTTPEGRRLPYEVLDRVLEAYPPVNDTASGGSAPPSSSGGSGSTMQASFIPGLNEYLQHDFIPALKATPGGISAAFRNIRNWLSPASTSDVAGVTARILRAKSGELARKTEQTVESLKAAQSAFTNVLRDQPAKQGSTINPNHPVFQFIDAMETGRTDELPQPLKGLAQTLHEAFQERVVKVQKQGRLETVIENYFPHIWTQPGQAEGWLGRYYGKRPMEGGKSFLKKRKIPTTKDGLEAGLEPVSFNPIDLALLKLREMDRWIFAHEAFQEMKKNGIAKFVRAMAEVPDGYAKLDDRIAQVVQVRPTEKKDGTPGAPELVQRGHWYAPEDAARVFNNFLSPGLRGQPVYDAVSYVGNMMNQAQLGLSAFHLTFTTLDAMISKVALGIEQVSRGQVLRGAGNIAKGVSPYAPIENFLRGSKVLEEYLTPGRIGTETAQIVDALQAAGGRVRMDSFYKNSAVEAFINAMEKGNIPGAIIRVPSALFEMAAKPLMEYIVPRQKLGVFADLARMELERLGPTAGRDQVRKAMAQAWDSVDNRMGQLVYDNLFWQRTLKDLGLIMTRSLGWNMGTLREIGGGVMDTATLLRRAKAGDPKVTHRMAYVLALPMVVALYGAIMTYLYTGKGPTELLDYFQPPTGKRDKRGRKERVQLPTYMRDIVPDVQAGAKGLQATIERGYEQIAGKRHPLIDVVSDMLGNRDFYGDEIRNERDPLVKQAMQEGIFIGKQFLPFSARPAPGRPNETAGEKVQRFFGITPAPKEISKESRMRAEGIRKLMEAEAEKHGESMDAYRQRIQRERQDRNLRLKEPRMPTLR